MFRGIDLSEIQTKNCYVSPLNNHRIHPYGKAPDEFKKSGKIYSFRPAERNNIPKNAPSIFQQPVMNSGKSFSTHLVSIGGFRSLGQHNLSISKKRDKAFAIANNSVKLNEAIQKFNPAHDGSVKVDPVVQNTIDNYVSFLEQASIAPWPVNYNSLTVFCGIALESGYTTVDDKVRIIQKFARFHEQYEEFSPNEEYLFKTNIRKQKNNGAFDHSQALPCDLEMIEKNTEPSSIKRSKSLLSFYFALRPDELQYISKTTLTQSADKKWYCLDLTKVPNGLLKRRVINTCTVKCCHVKNFPVDLCICSVWKHMKKEKLLGKFEFDETFKKEVSQWTGEPGINPSKGYAFRIGAMQSFLFNEQQIGEKSITRHLRWSSSEMQNYYARYFKFPSNKYRDVLFMK